LPAQPLTPYRIGKIRAVSRDVGSNGKSGSPDCVRTEIHGRSYPHDFSRKIDAVLSRWGRNGECSASRWGRRNSCPLPSMKQKHAVGFAYGPEPRTKRRFAGKRSRRGTWRSGQRGRGKTAMAPARILRKVNSACVAALQALRLTGWIAVPPPCSLVLRLRRSYSIEKIDVAVGANGLRNGLRSAPKRSGTTSDLNSGLGLPGFERNCDIKPMGMICLKHSLK
jgi:hypothetical protein